MTVYKNKDNDMEITKIEKSNESSFLGTDLYLSSSRRVHINKTVRDLLGIEKNQECETFLKVEFVKFDSDLPCRCHIVKVFFQEEEYDGIITEDLGARTGQPPVLGIK
jgi:hypothetical protein